MWLWSYFVWQRTAIPHFVFRKVMACLGILFRIWPNISLQHLCILFLSFIFLFGIWTVRVHCTQGVQFHPRPPLPPPRVLTLKNHLRDTISLKRRKKRKRNRMGSSVFCALPPFCLCPPNRLASFPIQEKKEEVGKTRWFPRKKRRRGRGNVRRLVRWEWPSLPPSILEREKKLKDDP